MSILLVLICVAFFTFMERKILGLCHNRLGPSKVFLLGLFQPFRDALKLFSKGDLFIKRLISLIFLSIPLLMLFFSLVLWVIYFFWGFLFYCNYSLVFFIRLRRFFVYFILYIGWSRGSRYRLLGSYRSSAQRISYEIIMILLLLIFCFYFYKLTFINIFFISYLVLIFGLMYLWFLSCLAESRRSPFDFVEGESELVSGFNTELGGGLFSLIFISEYRSIIFLCFISGLLFWGGSFMLIVSFNFMYLYVWVRSSYPRLRYDYFLMFGWKGASFYLLGYFYFC